LQVIVKKLASFVKRAKLLFIWKKVELIKIELGSQLVSM
jgi:hypothetical protein